MFRFVSSEEALTPELETDITAASAWAHITPTGATKPVVNAGALVIQSFSELNNRITAQDRHIATQNSRIATQEHKLNEEIKARTEANLVIANHVAQIKMFVLENRF